MLARPTVHEEVEVAGTVPVLFLPRIDGLSSCGGTEEGHNWWQEARHK